MEPKQAKKKLKNILTVKDNIFPSKYIREKYPHLNKVVPKTSILFKVKYKPDIIVNQKNQQFKNINFNQNKIPPLKINLNDYNNRNYFNQNKYYNEFTNNTLLNYLDENNSSIYNYNKTDNNNNIKINNYEDSFYRNNEKINKKELKENNFNKENKIIYNNDSLKEKKTFKNEIINNRKMSSQKDNSSINENIDINYMYENSSRNDSFLKFKEHFLESNSNKKYGYYLENFNNYNTKNKNTSSNLINIISKETSDNLDLINDSFKEIRTNSIKSRQKSLLNNNKYDDIQYYDKLILNNIELNEKLKHYRIRLVKEFFKYLRNVYLKKYYKCFIEKVKDNNNTYKIIKKNNKISNNSKSRRVIQVQKNYSNENNELINIYNNLILKKDIKKLNYRNNNIKNPSNNSLSLTDNNLTVSSKNERSIKSIPRVKINTNYLSINRKINKKLSEINSFSSLNSLNFNTEVNIKENELFRDSKELNKKYNQIQIRKIRESKSKNKSVGIKLEKVKIKSDIDTQFIQIRKYMELIKNNKGKNSSEENSNTFNSRNRTINKISNNKTYNNDKKNAKYFSQFKNNIFYSKNNKKKRKNVYYETIKNISTKDGRININIKYYFMFRKKKPVIERYSILTASNIISIIYFNKNEN